jgi:hypothetical protein
MFTRLLLELRAAASFRAEARAERRPPSSKTVEIFTAIAHEYGSWRNFTAKGVAGPPWLNVSDGAGWWFAPSTAPPSQLL